MPLTLFTAYVEAVWVAFIPAPAAPKEADVTATVTPTATFTAVPTALPAMFTTFPAKSTTPLGVDARSRLSAQDVLFTDLDCRLALLGNGGGVC